MGRGGRPDPPAEIEGHVLIGKDAVVGRDVKLLGDVTVGSDCWIRPNVTIKRSILPLARAWAAALTWRIA